MENNNKNKFFCPFTHGGCKAFGMNSGKRAIQPANNIWATTNEVAERKAYIIKNLRIPVLQGQNNLAQIRTINQRMENDIMEYGRQIEEGALWDYQEKLAAGEPFRPYTASNTFVISYNRNNIVSVVLTYYTNLANNNYYVKTSYNSDIRTGKSLMLEDLFKPGVNYRQILDREVIRYLQANQQSYFPQTVQDFKGIAVDQPFYLENDGIVLFFGFHQVAPIAAGIPLIKVPFGVLTNYLREDFIRG